MSYCKVSVVTNVNQQLNFNQVKLEPKKIEKIAVQQRRCKTILATQKRTRVSYSIPDKAVALRDLSKGTSNKK